MCRVGTITGLDYRIGQLNWTAGLDYWTTGLDYWTTGLTQTAKHTSFSAEQKLNILIHSLKLLLTAYLSKGQSHVHI